MKLDELTTLRFARYNAELTREETSIQLAETTARLAQANADAARQRGAAILQRFIDLHRAHGLDVDVHGVVTDEMKASDGSTVPAGTVIVRKTGALYEPPAPPAAVPEPAAPVEPVARTPEGDRLLSLVRDEIARAPVPPPAAPQSIIDAIALPGSAT